MDGVGNGGVFLPSPTIGESIVKIKDLKQCRKAIEAVEAHLREQADSSHDVERGRYVVLADATKQLLDCFPLPVREISTTWVWE